MRAYTIGDIHGHLDLLQDAMGRISADRRRIGDADAPVVFLGDFCDRGPDTRGVLDYLIEGQVRGEPWVFLRGNHDSMMECFLRDPSENDPHRPDVHWLEERAGGRATLASYGVPNTETATIETLEREGREAVPAHHCAFLRSLPTSYRLGDVFFCHAGVRPGVELDQQGDADLLWIREEFLDSQEDFGALIVHGHTPTRQLEHMGNRINLDQGAAFGGPLSVVVLEGTSAWEVTADGRRYLEPLELLMA